MARSVSDPPDATLRHPQAYAFSRGLREIIPLGVLELFSVEELQALLGAGPAVGNAALADWKRHTEYGNGLDASSDRVKWFWEVRPAVSPLSCVTARARLLGSTRGGWRGCAAYPLPASRPCPYLLLSWGG